MKTTNAILLFFMWLVLVMGSCSKEVLIPEPPPPPPPIEEVDSLVISPKFRVLSYSDKADRFGGGDFSRDTLFLLSNIPDGSWEYTLKLGGEIQVGRVEVVDEQAKIANNPTTGNLVQAVANTGLVFVRVNPVTGIILGVADVTGASDFVYDKIGDAIDNLDSSNAHQDVLKKGNLCFPGDMKVMMACGEYKRIDEIVIGDVVMSYDFDTQTLNPTIVKRIDSPYHYEMVYLRFSKKIEIRSTQDHPIWIEGKGWASVKNELSTLRYKLDVHSLEEGDKCIVYVNGRKKIVKLKRIEQYYENQITYNLTWLENGFSYIVNGVIVSNESNILND